MQVCDYHKTYYRPDNLCLIVTGQVTPEELFKSLAPFEDRILSKVSMALSHLLAKLVVFFQGNKEWLLYILPRP